MFFEISNTGYWGLPDQVGNVLSVCCGNTFPCLVWSEILKIALFLFFQKPLKVLLQDAFCILKMIFDRSVNDPQEDIRRVLNLNLLRESHLPILTLFLAMSFSEN
jgi:hypothetical protein